MYDIKYNGTLASDLKMIIKERPNIPAPQKKYESIEVAGIDGSLIQSDGTYEDILIPISFNYIASKEKWMDIYRQAKQWLYSDGNRELVLADDPGYFFKVKRVEVGTNERTSLRVGNFSATFICEPYQYAKDGKLEYSPDNVLYNRYVTSHPVYIISGSGECELWVNGKSVQISVDEYIVLDTGKMLAYKNDVLQNTNVRGNYEDLYLQHGKNEMYITDGFTISVIPNWRCL